MPCYNLRMDASGLGTTTCWGRWFPRHVYWWTLRCFMCLHRAKLGPCWGHRMRGTSVPPAAVVQHQCHTELPTRPCRHDHSCHPFPRQPQTPGWQTSCCCSWSHLVASMQPMQPHPSQPGGQATQAPTAGSAAACCYAAARLPSSSPGGWAHTTCTTAVGVGGAATWMHQACRQNMPVYQHAPSAQHCYPACCYGTRATVPGWVALEQQLCPTCCGWSPPPSRCQLLATATAQPALLEPLRSLLTHGVALMLLLQLLCVGTTRRAPLLPPRDASASSAAQHTHMCGAVRLVPLPSR